MTQTQMTLLAIALPLIGGGIGYFIKYYVEKSKEIANELTKQRREIYQQYVNLIIGLFAKNKTKKTIKDDAILIELFEFYKKYVLFASPNVIKAFSDYFQFLYNQNSNEDDENSKRSLENMTKVMLEMRKDIGLKNKGLGKNGELLLRALINDYDRIWK